MSSSKWSPWTALSGFGETPKKTPPEEIPPAAAEQFAMN
jgi:hypothetical protein